MLTKHFCCYFRQSIILPTVYVQFTLQAARCYVESCNRNNSSSDIVSAVKTNICSHVKAAIECAQEAQPLTLKNSVLNSLQVRFQHFFFLLRLCFQLLCGSQMGHFTSDQIKFKNKQKLNYNSKATMLGKYFIRLSKCLDKKEASNLDLSLFFQNRFQMRSSKQYGCWLQKQQVP